MSINNCVLMGRITADLETRQTANGVSVLNFTIAVDRRYQAQGEEKKTDFIDCVAWRNTADFISKYFGKGQMIAVAGEILTDTYTDKDGNKRKKTEISVSNASFCGGKQETQANAEKPLQVNSAPVGGNDVDFAEVDSDELPF